MKRSNTLDQNSRQWKERNKSRSREKKGNVDRRSKREQKPRRKGKRKDKDKGRDRGEEEKMNRKCWERRKNKRTKREEIRVVAAAKIEGKKREEMILLREESIEALHHRLKSQRSFRKREIKEKNNPHQEYLPPHLIPQIILQLFRKSNRKKY